jgi:HlyD family secretion protein
LAFSACNPLNEKSDAYGNFEAREIMISAQSNGKLLEFIPREGNVLEAGTLAGWIDTSSFFINILQIEANKKAVLSRIDNIKAQKAVLLQKTENLKTDHKRIQQLFRDEAATQKQVDDINGALKVAQKEAAALDVQINAIKEEMNVLDMNILSVRDKIEKCRIENPVKGSVLSTYVENSEFVVAGKPLYKIARMDQLELRIFVSGKQLQYIKTGQKVRVFIDNEDETLHEMQGKLIWISEKAEFTPKVIQTRDERVDLVYAAKVLVNNDGRLKIGMPAEVKFK